MRLLSKNVMRVTFCHSGKKILSCLFSAARYSPTDHHKTKALPADVRRQDQEPGNIFTVSNFAAQRAEEITVTNASVFTEYGLPNLVDNKWHDDQADKQEACE